MNIVHRVVIGVKKFAMRWSGGRSWYSSGLSRTRFNYEGQVNTGSNAIVMACVLWLARTFPEAPMRVRLKRRNGDLEPQPDHALLEILKRPNPYYSGELLWMATLADWILTGNGYWAKVRSGGGRVVELWWLPARQVEPKYPEDGSQFISHYEYNPSGSPTRLRPEDVVHLRYGLDPDNPRKGLSPLASLLREVFTDDEAANFSASLLRNLGVPGVVISPDSDNVEPSQEELDYTKQEFAARFGGDNRGSALVMKGKTRVQVLSFSPEQMNLKALRRLPEERVTAILGTPAIVVGLGAGLDRSTFANYEEARQAAYEGNVIPTQRLLAAELSNQLLPDFGDPTRLVLDFDLSEVRVLQPDLDKLFTRLDVAVKGGWMMPNEAREKVGLDPLPGGDVVYVPNVVTPTEPENLIPPEPEPMALPDPNADPTALPPPKPLRALPAAHPGKGRKAAGENLAEALHRVRARHHAPLEKELDNYLRSQRARVVGALSAQEKALNWRDLFDAVAETRGLTRILERWYKRVLLSVHALTEDSLGISFDLDDPTTRRYLAEAGKEIVGITEHTRGDIARALQEGQVVGEGIPQLAQRIESLTAFNRARATTIARTELGQASNEAALASYEASGVVVGVEVFDSTHDPACAEWAGRRVPLSEARAIPRLGHPNCIRALGAIVDASELEGAA